MSNKLKRFLSLMLVFVMVFSVMPTNAETSAGETEVSSSARAEEAVAVIGEATYATLTEAFQAAAEGDTITLQSDVEEVVRLSVSDSTSVKSITLDLNGKTWDCGYGTRINAVSLTVKNGIIGTRRWDLKSGDTVDVFYFGGHSVYPSTMTLTGVTFNAELRVNNMAPSDEELGLLQSTLRTTEKAPNATSVIIQNGQFDVVTVQKAAYLTINGGFFSGIHAEEGAFVTDNRNKDGNNESTGTVTEDGTTTNDVVEIKEVYIKTLDELNYARTEKGVTITFVDYASVDERDYMKFTVGANSTTFTVQVQTADGWKDVAPNSGTSTIEHKFTEPGVATFRCDWGNNGTYDRLVVLVKSPVAKVGDTPYTSIDEAVAAWTDGTTLTILTDAEVNLGSPLALLADDEEITLVDNITAADGDSALVIANGNVVLNVNADITLTGGKGGAGIYVAEGASLTIKGSGTLTAIGNGGVDTADSGAAGIGGTYANGNSGAITIDGATVVAKGYGKHGSGIGSGSGKVVGEIKIINGANVTAYGGYYADGAGTLLQSSYGKSDPEGGAAIGGGGKTASTIADITITDSTVVAYGGSKAAGIGANFWSNCGTITISGNSNVTAQGGSSSAGIGTSRAGDTGVTANIVISGGTVTATGGAYGAGIGGGYNADSLGNGADASALPEISVTISGGTVTATGGEGGAGVGGGYKTDNIDIDITGGTVTAQAGALVSGKTIETGGEASAIGAGANGSGVFENCPAVEIAEAATVTAYTLDGGKPAIEGDTDENWDALDNVTIIKPWYDPDATEYIIMNADEMLEFAETVATGVNFEGKVVKLGDNIDLSGIDWAPIGGDSVYFAGEFDGQDYAIKNLTQTTGARMGLFGLVEKAYLHDFTMQNVNFTVNDNSARVGAIAGNLQYWNVVENVTIDGINIVVNGNDGLIGAAAGYVWKSQLGNVDVNNAVITVNGTGNVVAGHTAYGRAHVWDTGVTGNNAHWLDGTVQTINGTEYVLQNYFEGCDVSGIKMTLNGTGTEAGGFFGSDTYNSHSNYFVNCGVSGLDVTAAAGTSQLVGGFIAWNNGTTSAGTVKGFNGCSVSGTIKGANGTYGGFVGQVGGRACEYNNATANVNITSSGTAGGFVGITQAYSTHKYTFNNCTAKGSVSGVVAGGFTGKNGLSGDGKSVFVTYNFCSASGAVSATTTAGGFIGQVNTELPATNWNIVDSTGSLVLKGNTASTVVNGDGTVGYLIGYLDGVANGDAKEGNTVVVELTGNTPDGSDIGTGTGHHINISGDTILSDIVLHDSVAKVADEYYATLDEAFEAAVDGNEVEILVAGTYALNTSGKDITITGTVDGVVFDNIGAKNMGSANVTFNNVTFDYYPNVNYTGLQHSGNLVYNDCTFEGQVFLYGTSETFNNCTFNQNSADAYNVWTYGAGNVEFKGCTFNSVGKSVLLYSESNTAQTNLNVVDCDFIATAPVEGKAAIEIDTSLMKNTVSKVTIDAATTATGFDAGTVSGVSLWNDKRNQTNIEVWVDGVQVWPIFVASITDAEGNETKYNSLAAAVEAAEAGAIITVIGDHEITEPVVIEKDVTIDLNGKTVTGKEVYPMIRVQGGATVTVKNGTMTNDDYVFVLGASDGSSAGNLTIESGSYTGETTVASVTKGTLTVTGGEFKVTDAGYGMTYLLNCIDANYKDGSATIVVTGGTFHGFNPEANAAEGTDTNFVAEGYEAVESSENVWTVQVHYVAQVGETKYTSLAEAVAAANAIEGGATVTLLDDVTLGEKLTISGNVTIEGEYTITRDDAYTGTLFAVPAGAALTLDGGLTIDGGNNYSFNSTLYEADLADWENPIATADSTKWFTPEEGAPVATAYMITTSGEVNLNNVSIKNHYSTNGSGIVSASKGANVTLDGAQITHNASTSGSGLVVNASAGVWSREEELITVTMNAGTVIDGNHVGGNHGVFKIYMGTYFTMNGGEVKNTTGWNSNGTVVGIYHAVFTMNGGTICTNSSVYGPNNGRNAAIYGHSNHLFTMNGGTICHNTGRSKAGIDSPYSETGYTGLTVITGGTVVENTILGTWTAPDVSGGATMTITGGTYTQDVNQWCPYGYEAIDNGDGTWTVQEKVLATLTFNVDGVEKTVEYKVTDYESLQHLIGTNDYADFVLGAEVSPLLAYVAGGNVTDIVLTLNSDLNESLVLFDTYYQMPVSYSMTLNLNGYDLTSTGDAITVNSGVSLTINGDGTVAGGSEGSWTAVWANGGDVIINGGTYSVGGDSAADQNHQNDVIYTKDGGTVTINGGEFLNDGTVWTLNENDSNRGTITVYGGTFHNWNPADNVSEGEGTDFVAEGYISVANEDETIWTVRKANYIAQVGDVKYESLQEAINACTDGQTVQLIANVIYTSDDVVYAHGGGTGFGKYDKFNPSIIYTGGTNVDGVISPSTVNAVLDLNGYTITNNADAYMFMIMDNTKLTFKDSVGTGSITNTAAAPVIWAVGTETLVKIESGKYVTANAEGLLWSTHGADMVIYGGNFSTTADASLLIVRNEKDLNNDAYFVDGNATITIYGGTYNYNPEKTYDDSTKPYTEFNAVADGFIARQNGENTWIVGEGEWAAQVGETKYETFEAALEVAQANETDKTVILLKPVEISEDTTYDLSGVTVTSEGDAFIVTGGTLTLNGNGVVKAGTSGVGSWTAVWANGGDVIINGGTYSVGGDLEATDTTHQNDVIYTKNGGTVTITGGEFLNDGNVWTLNENDSNRDTITVTGGKFYGWNPEANVSEGPNTNFLESDKYIAIEESENVFVVWDYVDWIKDQLVKGNDVSLVRDVTITDYSYVTALVLPSNGNGKYTEVHGNGAVFHVIKPGVEFDLNGHTLTWDAHDDAYCNKRQVSLFMVTITGNAGETSSLTVVDSVGNGNVNVYGMGTAVYVVGVDAKADITGGTWTNYPCECGASNIFIYPSHGGMLAISSGIFQQKDSEYLIGWKGSTKETTSNNVGTDFDETLVSITGGTFVNFNPETETKFFDVANSGQETINGVADGYIAKLVDGTENNWIVVKGKWVAQVGETKYATLAEAVRVAQGTANPVVVLTDFTEDTQYLNQSIAIPVAGDLTVDLAGYTVDFNGFYIVNGTVEIKNGTLNGTSTAWSTIQTWTVKDSVHPALSALLAQYGDYVGEVNLTLTDVNATGARHALRAEGGDVTVNGGSFTATASGSTNYAINVGGDADSTVVINNTVAEGKSNNGGNAIAVKSGSTLTIYDGNYSSNQKTVAYVMGTMVLYGGTYTEDVQQYCAEGYKAVDNEDGTWTVKPLVTVTFDDVTMVVGNEMPEFTYTTNFTEVAEDGTMLVVEIPEVTVEGAGEYEITANAYVFMSEDYAVEVVPGTLTVLEAVAQIGDVKYASIQEAVDAAQAGETVTVIADVEDESVTVNKTVIIDLNGNNVSSTGDVFTVVEGGNLTINGEGEVKGGTSGVGSWTAVWANGGNVTINGGTYSVGGDSTEGTDQTHQNDVIYTKDGGTVTITGGTFQNNGTVWTLNKKDGDTGTITVTGGTFYGWNPEANVSEGPNTNFCAAGYIAKPVEGENAWNVVKGEWVAQIGDVKYASVQEAVDAAQAGETVKLIADVTITESINVAADDQITLDLNGHTLQTDATVNDTTSVHVIVNVGDLTITDSEGNGAVIANDCATADNGSKTKNGFAVSSTSGSSLTINGAKIVGTNWGYALYVVDAGTTVTLNDAVVEGRGALYLDGGATGTVNGGSYTMTVQTTNSQDNVVYVGGASELTINGGTFTTGEITGSQRIAIAALGTSKVTINDGEFYGLTGDIQSRTSAGNVVVTGGTFTGTKMDERTADSIALTGGTYSYDPADWVAEGYKEVDNGDGTWTVVEDGLFDIAGSSVKVGDSLDIYFYVKMSDLDGTEYYAEIVREYADEPAVTVQIPYDEWSIYGSDSSMIRFVYSGIAAKEMTDALHVTVYNNDGTVASNTYDDSVRDYAVRGLAYYTDAEIRAVYVDMLNYGAATQEQFGYHTDDLANAGIDEYQSYATESVTYSVKTEAGPNYAGSTVSAKNQLVFTFYFTNITPEMTARISYTDHNGNAESAVIDGSNFHQYNSTIYGARVTGLSVADGRQLITCEIIDVDGTTVVASAKDSVESYVARAAGSAPVFELLMKFVQSSYNYFH